MKNKKNREGRKKSKGNECHGFRTLTGGGAPTVSHIITIICENSHKTTDLRLL